MLAERTPWFKCIYAQPVRIGWYETSWNLGQVATQRYWDGNLWRPFKDGPIATFGNSSLNECRGCIWRGLTKEHE